MKTVMIQNFSRNNESLFNATYRNHQDYCSRWGYAYLTYQKPYSPTLDFDTARLLLQSFDVLVTIGSDCLITNFDRNLADYAKNFVSVCEEGGNGESYVNAEIMLFNNSARDSRFWDFLQTMEQTKPRNKERAMWGLQTVINENYKDWMFLDVIPASEKIQSYDAYVNPGDAAWTKEHIMLHCYCGTNAEKELRIRDFARGHGIQLPGGGA